MKRREFVGAALSIGVSRRLGHNLDSQALEPAVRLDNLIRRVVLNADAVDHIAGAGVLPAQPHSAADRNGCRNHASRP